MKIETGAPAAVNAVSQAEFALPSKVGKLAPGIYQRFTFASGTSVKPVMFFVALPSYKRRLDFYGIAERKAVAEFNRAFPQYLAKLLQERGL